jgi:succinyl-CoA synthetase beta subunit
MSNDNVEWIPINPLVNTKRMNDLRIANSTMSVRDHATTRVVIPPPPVDERVEVSKPAARRQFLDPNARGGRPVRRD